MEMESQKTSAYAARKFGRGAALALAMASAGLGVSLYMAPAPAYAIYCSNCSTFYQQMYEYAEAVNTQLNTAQQLQTQIQQYDNMIKQGMSLPSRMFNTITGDLQRVASVYNSAQSLGRNISNLDEQFRQQFKGYDSYLNSIGQGQNNMPQRYRDWAQSGFDNARTAMQAAGVNTSTFEDENAMLDQLVSRSQSAVGRQQAIQAGNEIAAQNVQQLQKLRDLVATQITLQGNYMAKQTEQEAVKDAASERFWGGTDTPGPSKGF
ncbi:TPA: P-type conjugative transfer protein TrbJ [Klebsiella pneumoniae]|uniref:P-type conjugative transfer protein TrbJ n=1 Tax=Klebsiella TaxID=570 RepID=UPI00227CB220|nr:MULTISPECIES: P-type conjugative transfer protein TrbJ [Klebsiella]HCB2273192.1 P-type conjugative transfer protein TrbJ [Citrobacter koseri]MCY4740872.1 P-type conjugative transfer protein TrbJ [Klebsiella pneumoniae]MDQ9319947.1 P-type conjugative transfer protein TrbJ [Klebsiella aerogenes]HBT2921243.1 P-type conjugative transfer protein TrbJ [Klebsiella pneumoniae]HBT3406467.1 P-type conjugative transfer protein TrbJ [Klebsiella pneumoniae]